MSLLAIDIEAFSAYVIENLDISSLKPFQCNQLLTFMNQLLHAHAQLEFQQNFQTNFEAIQRLQALTAQQNANAMQTDETDFTVQLLAQQNLILAQQNGQNLNQLNLNQLGLQNVPQNVQNPVMAQNMNLLNPAMNNSNLNLNAMDTGSVVGYPQVATPTNNPNFQVPQTPSSARTQGKPGTVQTHSKVIFKSAKKSEKQPETVKSPENPPKSVVGEQSMVDSAFIGSNSSVGSTSPGQTQKSAPVTPAPEPLPHQDGLNITSSKFPVLQANPQVHVPCTAKCYHRCKLGLACPRHAHKHLEKMQRKQKQAENGEKVSSSSGCHPKSKKDKDGKLKSIETIASGSCVSNSNSSVLSQLTGNQQNKDKNGNKRTFLDLYEVYNVIGVGGGGMVYSGRRIADKLPVAIKRVMREKVKRWETVQGYQVPQEIALMLRCYGHPGVIRLVDWYECLDSFILIMERPERAVDLFDYIREVGRIQEKEAARIFSRVLDATLHIMNCGVVHRDLKDENIIMNRDTGEAKIIDFGCGTLLRETAYRDFSGTPEFYPPEWFTTREYYARTAAVWSLGVLLFDMLQGEIPFKQKEKIVENNPNYKHQLSPEAKHLVQWLMSTDPKNRPSMNEISQHPWLVQHMGSS